jgi:hypothetical protein
MGLDPYHRRRLVSRIAFHVTRGKTWEEICALNSRRRDAHSQDEMDACREAGYQAVANAKALNAELKRRQAARDLAKLGGAPPPVFPPLRLCDLGGCQFPEGG